MAGRRRKLARFSAHDLLPPLEIIEEMKVVGRDCGLDLRAGWQDQVWIDTRDPDLAVSDANGEELLVTELLADHDGAREGDLIVVRRGPQPDMLRAHADADRSSDA